MASTAGGWQYAVPTDTLVAWPAVSQAVADKLELLVGGKNIGEFYIGNYVWNNTTTVTIDNVFTTEFDEYRIVIASSAAAGYSGLTAIPRSGGLDISTNITSQLIYTSGTTLAAANYTAAWRIGDIAASANGMATNVISLFNPMNTSYNSTYISDTTFPDNSVPATNRTMCAGSWRVTTAMQGIKFISSTNHTAKITIYGKRK